MSPVPKVDKVRVYFDNGRYIEFVAEEISVNLCQTIQKDSEGTTETPVEYYMITTAPIERMRT